MAVWAFSDLHLAFGVPQKSMEVFGPAWANYAEKIQDNWSRMIKSDDLVLIPGDLSWALKFEDALVDLKWIDALPGTKLILRGNHDYWWPTNKKLQENLPPSFHFINNNTFLWNDIAFGGARLWDSEEFSFERYINFQENPLAKKKTQEERLQAKEQAKKIFERELGRLRASLEKLDKDAKLRIALTHYPPVSADLKDSRVSQILEEFNINICVFGHLHNVKKDIPLFGEKNQILYLFTSCDYLNFEPLLIVP